MSSPLRVGAVGLAIVALGLTAMWATGSSPAPATTTIEPTAAAVATDTVARRTLEQSEEFAGSLGYGEQFTLPGQASGTLTAAPEEGAVLEPGDELYRVDERPAYWAQGDLPMYRSLGSGDEGADVEQLQRYLQSTGHLSAEATIDGEFGAGTRAAVKAWQDDHGLKETGRIDATQLLFLPYESIRVATVPRVGTFVGGGVLDVTESDLFVTVDIAARKRRVFEGAPTIEVETADGSRYDATVDSITAQQSQDDFGGQRYRVVVFSLRQVHQLPGRLVEAEVIPILGIRHRLRTLHHVEPQVQRIAPEDIAHVLVADHHHL